MLKFKKVNKADIVLGMPLHDSVYDKKGILLLNAGYSIASDRQLNTLLENGLFFSADDIARKRPAPPPAVADEELNMFVVLDTAKAKLKKLFDQFRMVEAPADCLQRVMEIAMAVQKACSHDTDAALANMHLDYASSYEVVHHMHVAILCEIVGKKKGIKDNVRLKLIKAALTHDIDLLDIQQVLDQQTSALTDQQQARIRNHPKASANKLRALGVTDRTWLDAVDHHHERIDGSGYGDALSGDAISTPTRVLALADIYSAMIRDRASRKAMISQEAMRKLMLEQGGKIDAQLIRMLIKEIGVFPPGAIVQLANNEIAVVKHKQENSVFPIVYAFINQIGMPVLAPQRRETVKPEHNIKGMVPFWNYRGSIAVIRSLWVDNPT